MRSKFLLLLSFSVLCINVITAQNPQLWGLTQLGGTYGVGTLFKINGDGSGFSRVYSMTGGAVGNLLPVNNTFYGLTTSGGTHAKGEVFRFDLSNNSYHTLFSMDSASGYYPQGSLVKASNGKYYGTTSAGGAKKIGTLFSFDPGSNTFTKVHDCDTLTGYYPLGNLVEAANGKLYGLMEAGGHEAVKAGCVFSLDPANNTYTDEFDFVFALGFTPLGNSMIRSSADDKLYGMVFGGGALGYGVIFSFDPSNSQYSLLYSLSGKPTGSAPTGNLTDAGGNTFYGMTSQGGDSSKGTIFRFHVADSNFTKLHDFRKSTGESPQGSLLLASDGNLYGTTHSGGDSAFGVIFSYNLSGNAYDVIHHCGVRNGALPVADLIEFNASTGIEDMEPTEEDIAVYPNPTQGKLTVLLNATEAGKSLMRLCDLSGRVVKEKDMLLIPGGNKQTIDLSGVATGIYLLTVGESRTKIVVE